jgi:hypothetical protein
VICAKYGVRRGELLWNWRASNQGSDFVKVVNSLFITGSLTEWILKEGMKLILGDGRRIDFWNELGGDHMYLMNAFPRIYALSSKKFGMVESFGSWQGQNWVCKIPMRRHLFD